MIDHSILAPEDGWLIDRLVMDDWPTDVIDGAAQRADAVARDVHGALERRRLLAEAATATETG